MNRIAIAGLSIHRTDVAGLERVRRPAPERANASLRDLADELGASELVLLATCNRVEVIYAREEGDPPDEHDLDTLARCLAADGEGAADGVRAGARAGAADGGAAAHALRPLLLLRTGREAARHLFRVASSLDSLVVGEDQILAQVRDAYGRASDIGLVGPLLGPLFHHALAVGKQVRSDTELARHPVSLVNLAVHALLARPDATSLRIAVVGTGEMGRLVVRALTAAGLPPAVIANRTPSAARLLADDCGARAVSLDELRRGAVAVDALVSATAAPDVVLDAPALLALAAAAPSGRPLLAIDLAVPRDLAPVADPRVQIVDLDALRAQADQHRALRAEAAALAEHIIDHKLESFCRRLGERAAADAVIDLQSVSEELLARELAGLLSGRLAHLPDEDRRAVERWARATFSRLMHLPVAALKRLAHDMASAEDRGESEQGLPRDLQRDAERAPVKVRLGTRGSDLALWQARHIAARLLPDAEVEIVVLSTRGDRIDDVPLTGVEGKAFFTAEIERALLQGDVDLAVHSHKDLPTEIVPGLAVVAVPERAVAAERLLVAAEGWDESGALLPLRHGARVGTSSPRRQQQLLALRPDLVVEPLRGNVPTRVRRLREGRWHAILLAAAGLERLQLDLSGLHALTLPVDLLVPAPAQGALAVQVRADDAPLTALCRRKLHDPDTHAAIAAERWLLARAGGGCSLPLGAHVAPDGDSGGPRGFVAHGFLGADHPEPGRGARWAVARGSSPAAAAALLIARLSQDEPTGAGPLAGLHVVLVGSAGEPEGSLAGRRLAQLGALVRHERVLQFEDMAAPDLGARCARLQSGDALVLTSRRAAARLRGLRVAPGVLVAAVGRATAAALEAAGLVAGHVGESGARELALALPLSPGARVLFPCAEGAGPDLEAVLAQRDVQVDRLPLYRTVTARDPDPEVGREEGEGHVRVCMSPSAERASQELGRALTGPRKRLKFLNDPASAPPSEVALGALLGAAAAPSLLFSGEEALVAQLVPMARNLTRTRALESPP